MQNTEKWHKPKSQHRQRNCSQSNENEQYIPQPESTPEHIAANN